MAERFTTEITFYKVGLNPENWAYDATAFQAILSAGKITPALSLSRALAFGATFEITLENYEVYKEATYIKITTTDTDNSSSITRYAFLTNFLNLKLKSAYEVTYSLDDWANFILNSTEFPDVHMDGFVDHANIRLIDSTNHLTLGKCYGETNSVNIDKKNITYSGIQPEVIGTENEFTLPEGYKFILFYHSQHVIRGAVAQNQNTTAVYINNKSFSSHQMISWALAKENSSGHLYITKLYVYNSSHTERNLAWDTEQIDVTSPYISKYIVLDYVPVKLSHWFNIENEGTALSPDLVMVTDHPDFLLTIFDISGTDFSYFSVQLGAVYLTNEYIVPFVDPLIDYEIGYEGKLITKQSSYNNYMLHSLYQYSNEFQSITFGFHGAEIEVKQQAMDAPYPLTVHSFKIKTLLSPDAESSFIQVTEGPFNLTENNTSYSATTGLRIPAITQNYLEYKVAQISSGQTFANMAWGFGSIFDSEGHLNLLGAAEKTQNLISGGYKAALQNAMIKKADYNSTSSDFAGFVFNNQESFYMILNRPNQYYAAELLKELEYYGVTTHIEINEYLQTQQMQAFNFVRVDQGFDVHGIPTQAAKNIQNSLLNGVTLWTAADVGNKKVINYPKDN